MIENKPLWLVLNQASGSNDAAANARLEAALAAAGCAPARRFDCASGDLPTLDEVVAAGVGIVACHTGDGTLNALITALEGWDGAVLALPGGTTNLLSKSLHGDRTAEDIVSGIAGMHRVRRSCVRSDAGTALIEVVAGPGAKWSDVREGLREGDLTVVAGKTVEAVRESAGGAMVVLTDPDIGKPGGYAGVRLTPTADGLFTQGFGSDTLGEYLQQGLALLRRDFREGPHDDLGAFAQVHCASNDGTPIELMLDGERATGAAKMQFSLAELKVDLLAGA